jgi:hypothetical protein
LGRATAHGSVRNGGKKIPAPRWQPFGNGFGEKSLSMKRLSSLDAVPFPARLNRWADFRQFHRIVRLHNWSPGGACVTLPEAAHIGEAVHLISFDLRRTGRICWIAACRAGIEFSS